MRPIIAAILITSLLCVTQVSAEKKDIRGLVPLDYEAFGEPKVEINLSGSLFKFIGRAAAEEEPELGKFLVELKALRVRIYEPEQLKGNVADVVRHFETHLKKKGWEVIARIKEENNNVGVHALGNEESVHGLFVIISSENEELVLVNIAGNIDLAQVGKLGKIAGEELNLPNLDPTKPRPTKKQKKQIEKHREGAMQSIQDGKIDDAIAHLKQIPKIAGGYPGDLGLLAFLHQQQGNMDAAYYYLGRIYETRRQSSFAKRLYQHAQKLNPDNPLVQEKLSR